MRRWALVASVVASVLGVVAQSALAAPPPTLSGQHFIDAFFYPPIPEGSLRLSCHQNPDGTETTTFRASHRIGPPYDGTYTESGELTQRRTDPNPDYYPDLLSLRAEFTIDSPSGQVLGTVRLPVPVEDYAFTGCAARTEDALYEEMEPIPLTYAATITTASGVFADRGRGTLDIDTFHEEPNTHTLDQTFTSDLSAPGQSESALFGPRLPGGSFSAMSANAKRASPFTLYYAATVRKLYAYVDGGGAGSGSQTVRGGLYRSGSGGPGALVAPTFEFTVPAGMSPRWVPLYLAPPTRLQPGVYWLGLQSGVTNGVARFAWSSKANSRGSNIDGYADGPSDPFGTAALDDQQMSIFAAGNY